MASKPNPKDSMKSTWRTADRSTWTWKHKILNFADVHPSTVDQPIPVHAKTDKIPHLTQVSQHAFILVQAFAPILVQQAWMSLSGFGSMHRVATFVLYFQAFNLGVVHEVHMLRRLAHRYGFLDGDVHERDGVPDVGVGKVIASLLKTTGARIAMAIYLTYLPDQAPLDVLSSPWWWAWLPFATGLYGVVLDFWFYVYHRAMHDVGPLWKFHRTHHLTKHPNPLLTAYGDHEQEFFDMVGVPFLTYLTFRAMGMPLGFFDWWICHQYIVYNEVWGHSGIRVHNTAATTWAWLLTALGAEIAVEDHDLHHRKGYRKSHNYGKQTRLWDRIFGTCHERIESREAQIDYVNTASMPLF
ncbi:hypothetical protein HIM_07488 [Hirsutella minnesotensis 3608]|uniref:Fatty acid hydroxylase domain-containing protein n=1 Tax=Hirsutella minnesotensis 3608 TaxID=1043627 RepID=A0A0F8A478_9HYPO|nr:hypothetical protein HIM_07488 [Hirsutella minnesotensis 3608]